MVNRFVNSPAPNASKMRPKMLGIKLSFVGSGFDFFAVPTLFNVKKFCLITLQKSDLRKRNGVQEAAGSTPVTPTKLKQSSQCGGCFFRSGDRDQRPLANSNPPLGVPNAKRRHAAGSTPVTRAKKQSSQCGGCFFRSGDRDQRPLANSNSPLGVPNAKRRHAAGSTPVTRTNNYLKKY